MSSICIIAQENESTKELHWELTRHGFDCSIASGKKDIVKQITGKPPDLLLVKMDSLAKVKGISQWLKRESRLPIIAMAHREMLNDEENYLDIDDFITQPYDLAELVLRIRRLIQRNNNTCGNELIRCEELVIDLAKCEVSVGDEPVLLTFKEYELLKFLAGNRGRVFTREALLNSVWGYDYYGGDRTVDVHIRRLRSKIENSGHTFLETVRNIGYRFKKDG
ncbi:response regulator transcription factor [Chloroflexota bacterium]